MKYETIEKWSNTLDKIEDEMQDHVELEIPDLMVDATWTDAEGRVWRKVKINYGKTGGRWGYWRYSDKPELGIIVDSIFNGWSERFAGMLRVPFDGHVTESLMLVNFEQKTQ